MFQRKSCMFQNVVFVLALSLLIISFSVPFPLSAAEEKSAIDEISLGDLLNLDVSIATKTKTTVQEAPAIVSVITAEEIRNMGARNIIDVLRTVPGFDMTLPNNAVYQMNIRGMRSAAQNDNIKFMIDGHSMAALYGGSQTNFNSTPVANIKQIEIIRGPGSALYGTGAFLGVVNIITKKGGDEPSNIAVEGGSFDTVKTYGMFSHKKDDFSIALYGDYYNTGGYEKTIDSDAFGTRPKSAAPGDTTNHLGNQTVHTNVHYKDFYFSGFFQKVDFEFPVGISNALTDEDDSRFKNAYGEIGYKIPITDRGNLQIRTFYDYWKQDSVYEVYSEETSASRYGFPNGESVFYNLYVENSILGAEITADYKIAEGIQFVTGILYEYYDQRNTRIITNANISGKEIVIGGIPYASMQYLGGMTDISEKWNWLKEADRAVYALYGQGTFNIREFLSLKKWVENLSLTAGVRYDNYDDFGSTVNPRFGVVYAPVSDLYFKMLYGTAFRAPTFRDLYLSNNPSVVGNENLDPETITTAEALVGYNFTKNLKGNLTIFDIEAEDLIQRRASYDPDDKKKYIDNVGRTESSGLEAELKMSFGKQRYTYINATWQDVKDTTHAKITSAGGQVYTQDDINPGSVPEFYGNIGVNYGINEYINLNVWLNYIGERERSEEMKWDGENLVRSDQREPVKDRTLANASVSFRNFWKGLELQLSGFNLFNADHRDPEPTGAVKNDMPLAGTSFMGKVSYSF